jgi:hypothetical protein
MLRRTLEADCDEKAKVIAELKTASAQKEDRIVQLEDTVQNLLSRVSVLEKLKVGKDTEVLRLKSLAGSRTRPIGALKQK